MVLISATLHYNAVTTLPVGENLLGWQHKIFLYEFKQGHMS